MTLLVLSGAIAGVATALLIARFFAQRYVEILAVLLAVIAALYVGPTIGGAEPAFVLETLVALVLIALAVYALRASILVLAVGYALHGLWDLTHGLWVPHILPEWYAPMCVGYDLAVAVCIVYEYRRRASIKRHLQS
jgi:hypothetical protein